MRPARPGRLLGRSTVGLLVAAFLAGTAIATAPAQMAAIDPAALQRRLIAELTGWSDGRQTTPFSRSTPAERAAALAILEGTFTEVGLSARRHRYRLRNVSGVVDLLIAPYRGTNLVVEVPATMPEGRVVIVGAHYDSERDSPGAVDNATGVAVVVAVARQIAALETRAKDFHFVLFDQEEDDEVGSRAFARQVVAEGHDVHSVHVVDLAGWDDDGNGGLEIQSPAPHLEPLYREAARELSIPLGVIRGGSSDNKSFMAVGLPAVGVFQDDMTPHIHRATDTYETVNFDILRSMTRLVGVVLERLAAP